MRYNIWISWALEITGNKNHNIKGNLLWEIIQFTLYTNAQSYNRHTIWP